MKIYDFKNVKKIIEEKKINIDYVQLGMEEDWGWTNETVFENGEYEDCLGNENIAGISGSTWATPIMRITYKSGEQEQFNSYIDDNEEEDSQLVSMQKEFAVLTGGGEGII